MHLNHETFMAVTPHARETYIQQIIANADLLNKYEIRSEHLPYFFGQCAVETAGFTKLEESLYYTSTARLRTVWPSRFKSDLAAAPFVRNPQALANNVYRGRLGNTGDNDGWLYRGSGMKQTTGKANYEAVKKATGIDCVANPELLRSFPLAFESACVFWRDNDLARFARACDIPGLSKAVQGGNGGLSDRIRYTERFLGIERRQPNDFPALREGSAGERVIDLQTKLAALGLYEGVIDGDFGPATEAAVLQFQADNGLICDGVAGLATFTKLNERVKHESD